MQIVRYVLSDPTGNYVGYCDTLEEAREQAKRHDDRDQYNPDAYHLNIGAELSDGTVTFDGNLA